MKIMKIMLKQIKLYEDDPSPSGLRNISQSFILV